MAYTIDRYSGVTLTTVEDGTVDQTTDIKLVGKNYAGYGEIQNENFLHLLENFSRQYFYLENIAHLSSDNHGYQK